MRQASRLSQTFASRSAMSTIRFHSASDTGITDNREILTSGKSLKAESALISAEPHGARQLLHRCDVDDGLFTALVAWIGVRVAERGCNSHDRFLVTRVIVENPIAFFTARRCFWASGFFTPLHTAFLSLTSSS